VRQPAQRNVVSMSERERRATGRTMRTDSERAHRRHRGEPIRPCSAQPLDQERFDAVVKMVRSEDQVARVFVGGLQQSRVSAPRALRLPARVPAGAR